MPLIIALLSQSYATNFIIPLNTVTLAVCSLRQMVGSCKHGTEYSGSMKGAHFVDCQSDTKLLKQGFVSWIQLPRSSGKKESRSGRVPASEFVFDLYCRAMQRLSDTKLLKKGFVSWTQLPRSSGKKESRSGSVPAYEFVFDLYCRAMQRLSDGLIPHLRTKEFVIPTLNLSQNGS
jgi:hypothetical protein